MATEPDFLGQQGQRLGIPKHPHLRVRALVGLRNMRMAQEAETVG